MDKGGSMSVLLVSGRCVTLSVALSALLLFPGKSAGHDPGISVVFDFNFQLQPNVGHGFILGPSSANRGYVVEISPLTPSVCGEIGRAHV